MSEYTPTTEEMRAFYTAERLDGPHLEGFPVPTVEQAESEFDRWLAGVVAEEPEWAQRIRAMHQVKRGVKLLYAPDDWHAEREPIGEEEYFICDYDKTTWPCKTHQIIDTAVPVEN